MLSSHAPLQGPGVHRFAFWAQTCTALIRPSEAASHIQNKGGLAQILAQDQSSSLITTKKKWLRFMREGRGGKGEREREGKSERGENLEEGRMRSGDTDFMVDEDRSGMENKTIDKIL